MAQRKIVHEDIEAPKRGDVEYIAPMSREEIEAEIREFEQMYGMSSEEFQRRQDLGTALDTFETNVWAIFLDHLKELP